MAAATIFACIDQLPPVGEWKQVFLAGHDHVWLRGRLESDVVWELDTRDADYPSHIEVDRELVTHWAEPLPDPFDLVVRRKPTLVKRIKAFLLA